MIFWSQIQYFIGSFSTVCILIFLGLFFGLFAGINVPNGAGCKEENLLCQWLRLRQPKVNLTVSK